MKIKLISAILLSGVALPAYAQDTLNSNSGSEANANSGSVSGAESNGNQQGQSQTANNAGIGSSRNDLSSESQSGAISGSESESRSNSDQAQGQNQGQSANNAQSQGQDARNTQSQGQTTTTSAQQQASNMQGVSVSNTFNSTNHKRSYVGTNTAVPLAASSSFSSDYCGGTASGGASIAPIGVSIGGAAPTFDNSCRYLRLAEKAGMLGANYYNMQQPEMGGKAMSLMAWAVCMAGPQQDKRRKNSADNVTMNACIALGLLGGDTAPASPPAAYVAPQSSEHVDPLYTQKPNVTPTLPDDSTYGTPKTPRGSNDQHVPPVAALVH